METYNGHVRTPQDAIILFEACRLGLLPRVQRRLSEKERQLIKSGSVFVWDEREAGMRRWTDGKSWSASRVSGSFLCYREMEGKRGGSSSFSSAPASAARGDGKGDDDALDGPDGYRYKPDGLVKQSFSITTANSQHLHLISYYARSHPSAATLRQPTNDPMFRHIRPAKGLYPESSIAEASGGSVGTRSPMVGTPYASSPQQQMNGHGPAYARPPPLSHGNHSMPPGYSWPPNSAASTPNGGPQYSPYLQQNGGGQRMSVPQSSPHYFNQQSYNPHQQREMGPTAFDRAPPPMSNGGLPPPPPHQAHLHPHPQAAPPYGYQVRPGQGPPLPYSSMPQPYHKPPMPSGPNIDTRLNQGANPSYRDNLPPPQSYPDYRTGPPTQAGSLSTIPTSDIRTQGPPMALPPGSSIPSITTLMRNSSPPPPQMSSAYGYQSIEDASQQPPASSLIMPTRLNPSTSDPSHSGAYNPVQTPRHPGYQPPPAAAATLQNGRGGSVSPLEKPANGDRIPGIATAVGAAAGKGSAGAGFREDARALRQLDRAFAA